MSRQCPFYPESGLCWRRSPDTLVATHLGLARSFFPIPIFFRAPGLPSTLCSRGLFFQCAIAGATHHKPGLRCLAVAFRQAACSTRVSISLRSIPKSIGLGKSAIAPSCDAQDARWQWSGHRTGGGGEIGNINHLPHFAATFGSDLAGLFHTQRTQLIFGGAQLPPQEPDEFAAARRRNQAPDLECVHCIIDNFAATSA